MRFRLPLVLCALLPLLAACSESGTPANDPSLPDVAVVSLVGDTLVPPPMPAERQAELEANLADARATYETDPEDADAAIWLGRRTAYLWRYPESIDIFSHGIEQHPEDARMYRHRGHRYITVRDFEQAEADLKRAAELIEGTEDEVEPDGAPNAAGIPRSTLHTNIWYHLGLAHYLQGEFEEALAAYRRGLEASTNDDMYVATADWLYMTLRRLGRDEEAAEVLTHIHDDMEILENHDYFRRLKMYKGELAPEELLDVEGSSDRALSVATQGYGIGNWHLVEGRPEEARAMFEEVTAGTYWPAFGYIAAEADLARME